MTTSTYAVDGMSCGHCVDAVRQEVGRLDGVTTVQVDLDAGLVTVDSERPLDVEAVRAAVEEAGYGLRP